MAASSAELATFIQTYAERIHGARDELTALDSAIGDADHGINMDRGFTAVVEQLPTLREGAPGAFFKGVGLKLISTVGGASGPLYGTLFLRFGTSLGEASTVDHAAFVAAWRAGLEGVVARGKAVLDDKTMVDALEPAVAVLEAEGGGDWPAALDAAAAAAAAGRDRITPLVARKGRASYLGERSASHQDPGATSMTMLMETFRDTLRNT